MQKCINLFYSNTTIKTTSITGRTDSNGLLYSEFKTTDTMVLYAIAQDCVVIPVAVGGGRWAFHFSTFGNAHMTEHDLTCTVYYYRAN